MYQGKFSTKAKASQLSVHELIEQRNRSLRSAASRQPSDHPHHLAATKDTVPAATHSPPQTQDRRSSRTGTLVFYTGFFVFVFVFYLFTFLGMQLLREWLIQYESAQPTAKSMEIFEELFSSPDWEALYSLAGMERTSYEGKEVFRDYMSQKVGNTPLTFLETSAGLSGDKKYIVFLEEERLGAFTLTNLSGTDSAAGVPDWQLGSVEFFLQRENSFQISLEANHTAYVNGAAVDDALTVRIQSTLAQEYLPVFVMAPRRKVLEVSGLLALPTVTILDENGVSLPVAYDAQTRTFTEAFPEEAPPETVRELALNAVKTYAGYMSGVESAAALGRYFDRGSQAYSTITAADLDWVQTGSSYTFTDESVTDYVVYSDELFSVRVCVTLNITRKEDGSVKKTDINQTLFFIADESADPVCYQMTAIDTAQWHDEVKLTFREGETILAESFVPGNATTLTCPVVTAPAGKVFSGWMTEQTDSQGNQVMQLIFIPDESGNVTLPVGTVLEPMILYPLFDPV